ncbi:MAG: tRNA 2-selenouridine(34) synthase MnmH [Verrucomicrobia bacterium]|nr:MAG: tRNA 2-selenouridine(34) synthase MnmH [Verrucomicrobiota bacterium]
MELPTTSDFKRIVLDDVPLIDVRAPVEFEGGAFPTAVNLPLMNNEERHLVGIRYKDEGNTEAVKLGHELVSGNVKQERVAAWAEQLERRPDSMIYCFRGGLRSQISQQWIAEKTGTELPRLEGGYKAFRNYLLDQLDPAHQNPVPVILGGRTGTGKTILLQQLENAVDLESIANHRGSSFGRFTTPQPSPIDFENSLAWALIQHADAGHRHLVLEDEGRNIGDRYLPPPLAEHFRKADLVVLERSMEERVQITFDEYITAAQSEYNTAYGEDDGLLQWLDYMDNCIDRIRKRLGGLRHQQIKQLLHIAHESDNPEQHKEWIEQLLRDYYDPMYDYQIQNKSSVVVFKGNASEVLGYLQALD